MPVPRPVSALRKPGLAHALLHCMLEPVDFARVVQYAAGYVVSRVPWAPRNKLSVS